MSGVDHRGGHPDFSRWIVNVAGSISPSVRVDPPAPAVAHVRLYDGTTADVDVEVVSRARGFLCVSQPVQRDGEDGTWLAWIPAELVRRRRS